MAIARDPSVKPQKIATEEEKMLTTTIFKSIDRTSWVDTLEDSCRQHLFFLGCNLLRLHAYQKDPSYESIGVFLQSVHEAAAHQLSWLDVLRNRSYLKRTLLLETVNLVQLGLPPLRCLG